MSVWYPAGSALVPVTVTSAPAPLKLEAMACPIPLVPPVTSTSAPEKSKVIGVGHGRSSRSIDRLSQARSQKLVEPASRERVAAAATARARG